MLSGMWFDLFDWLPQELLTAEDQDTLRLLHQMFEEPAQTRRERWNDYVIDLGTQAIELSLRLEETTRWQVLDLADDLPAAAAFLATFRLIEQGELTVEDGSVLLDRALGNLADEWVEEVSIITTEPPQWISTEADWGDSARLDSSPLQHQGNNIGLQALLCWASRCVPDEWSVAFRRVVQQVAAIQAKLASLPDSDLQAALPGPTEGSISAF